MGDTTEEEEMQESSDEESRDNSSNHLLQLGNCEQQEGEKKKFKYGIVYLSYIPEGLTVKLLREIFSQFGDIGRIYLAPNRDIKTKKKSRRRIEYLEGWIEFKKKRVAKRVASSLNGTELSFARRGCKLNGQVWSLKYLHRFKWAHLTEDIAHDKAVRDQKLRLGIGQAKKQVNFYQKMTERSNKKKKQASNEDEHQASSSKPHHFYQNQPYNADQEAKDNVTELLSNIFKKPL